MVRPSRLSFFAWSIISWNSLSDMGCKLLLSDDCFSCLKRVSIFVMVFSLVTLRNSSIRPSFLSWIFMVMSLCKDKIFVWANFVLLKLGLFAGCGKGLLMEC